jgi:outer membrane receptor protein involved in Fe transport
MTFGVQAQTATAVVIGTVTDASGASVAGASVNVKNVETGINHQVTTDPQGRYRVPELQIGNYEVQAAQAGFQTVVRKGITLSVGSEAVIDLSLPVGQAQQTVTVEAEASTVDTTTSAVSNLVEPTQMRELPLNGRNFEQLLSLAPGVQVLPPSAKTLFGVQENYSIGGGRPQGQAFLIDNTNLMTYFGHGTGSGASGASLGIEAIAEFQTLTNTYSAQFGGNGAVVNAVSKSGTNAFHGSAYEFLRNSAMDARNFFDNYRQPGQNYANVPTFKRNQFGASLGGPIVKDKTFFFFNWESFRSRLSQTQLATVPDANAKRGLLPCASAPTVACVNGLANVGISPATASTLALYPNADPTLSLGGGIGQVYIVGKAVTNEDYMVIRVDHSLSAKDSLFARYIRDTADVFLPQATSPIPLYPQHDLTNNQFATLEWKRLVSPTIVNLARTSFLRPTEHSELPNSIAALAFFPGRANGRVQVNPLSQLGPVQDDPFGLYVNHFVFGDDVIWSRGAHSIRFGFNLDRTQDNTNVSAGNGGVWVFSNLLSLLQNSPTQFQGPQNGFDDTTRDMRELFIDPYINDEWKVLPRLTLNIGLRYEWNANPSERLNKLTNFVQLPQGGLVSVPNAYARNPSKNNWAPRVGFAWDVFGDHKTSVRGGFGIFYDVITAKQYSPGYFRSLPYTLSTQSSPPFTYPVPFSAAAAASLPTYNSLVDYQAANTPYQMQYNLNVQRDLGHAMILSVGYVGSRGVKLTDQRDTNPPAYTTNAAGQQVLGSLVVNGTKVTVTPNARINPKYGFLITRQTWGSSNYNSLQTSLNRRFTNRWQMQASYTFSKSLDYGSAADNQSGQGAGSNPFPQDPYNYPNEYGRSSFDRTHAFRLSSVYQTPALKNKTANLIGGGWQLSGIFSAVSGNPFTPYLGFDQLGTQQTAGDRPNLKPGYSTNPILGTPTQWFDPNAFSVPSVGVPGNLGRDTIIGPGLTNVDYSMSKTMKVTKISEQFAVQFRAEIFNIFNHANFAIPQQTAVFTQSTGIANGVPFSTGTPSATAGQISSTTTPARQIQLALKVTF